MRKLIAALFIVGITVGTPSVVLASEQSDGCDHGASSKDCGSDPSSNGKDCLIHGHNGGVNESHCVVVTIHTPPVIVDVINDDDDVTVDGPTPTPIVDEDETTDVTRGVGNETVVIDGSGLTEDETATSSTSSSAVIKRAATPAVPRSLPVTGTNTMVLALLGVGLIGVGVALRKVVL